MSVRIREARPLDALPTLALHRAVLEEGSWFVSRPDELLLSVDGRENEIRVLADAANSLFLVAGLPSIRVVGFLTLTGGRLVRTRHVGRIELMVAPASRGQGVGRALMEHAITWAEANSLLRKLSLAVFTDNERAVSLYRALGFQQEGHRVGEYREVDGTERDDLLMYRPVW